MNTKAATFSTNNRATNSSDRRITIMEIPEMSSHDYAEKAKALEQFIADALNTAD